MNYYKLLPAAAVLSLAGLSPSGASGEDGRAAFQAFSDAAAAHERLITTGRGHVVLESEHWVLRKRSRVEGEWKWKEGHWRLTGQNTITELESPSAIPKVEAVDVEIAQGALLQFNTGNQAGTIGPTQFGDAGPYRLSFAGISGIGLQDDLLARLRESVANGKVVPSVSMEQASDGTPLQVFRYATSELHVRPDQQSSMVYHLVKGRDGKGHAESTAQMELVAPGIWFPRTAATATYSQETTQTTIRMTFSKTELNVPLEEKELAVTLPAGSRISSSYIQGAYRLKEASGLAALLSGSVRSVDEEEDAKETTHPVQIVERPRSAPPAAASASTPLQIWRRIPLWARLAGGAAAVTGLYGMVVFGLKKFYRY